MKENMSENDESTKPPKEHYDVMMAGFNEVLRLAKIGAKSQIKGVKPSKHKDELMKTSLTAIAFVNSFLSGVSEEYKGDDGKLASDSMQSAEGEQEE